jgi:hypothetical protein
MITGVMPMIAAWLHGKSMCLPMNSEITEVKHQNGSAGNYMWRLAALQLRKF